LKTAKSFVKNTLIYGFAAALPKAVNVLLVRLHTETLSTSEYSVNTSFYVWAAYFNVVLTYGMETAFFRFFSTEKEKGKVLSTAFISLFLSTLSVLAVLLTFKNTLSELLGFSKPIYFSLLVWISILETLVVIPFAYLRVLGQSKKYTLFRILNISVYAFFNLLFLWAMPLLCDGNFAIAPFVNRFFDPAFKEGYIFIANLIASALTFVCVLPELRKFHFYFDPKILKKMLSYGVPILIAGLAYTTNENLDKLLLEKWLGKDVMGAYAGAYKIGVFMSLFVMAFRLGAEPFFFNKSAEKDAPKTYALVLKWFVIVGSFFGFLTVGSLDWIAQILLGNKAYHQALPIVPIILMANLFLGIYNNLSVWYKVTDKTRYGMYISLWGAGITLLLLGCLVPRIGFMGAAWATLAAYGSMCLLSYLLGKKHYAVPYDLKNMIFYLLVSTVLGGLSFLKFRANFAATVLLALAFISIVLIKEKSTLKAMSLQTKNN
jgi:O-antigen/teichoic acid export membrane protein